MRRKHARTRNTLVQCDRNSVWLWVPMPKRWFWVSPKHSQRQSSNSCFWSSRHSSSDPKMIRKSSRATCLLNANKQILVCDMSGTLLLVADVFKVAFAAIFQNPSPRETCFEIWIFSWLSSGRAQVLSTRSVCGPDASLALSSHYLPGSQSKS